MKYPHFISTVSSTLGGFCKSKLASKFDGLVVFTATHHQGGGGVPLVEADAGEAPQKNKAGR